MINSENYVANCMRTDAPITQEIIDRISEPKLIRLLHASLGFATESGEFIDALKKYIFYGKPLDLINLKEETGDLGWYMSLAIDVLKTTLDEVMTVNIDKLKARYPEKFTNENAINRNLDVERKILEN
jgi:NTP pyrophosphatase (non-canonical NTP hydrolase)